MKKNPKILIVGGGNAGLSVAAQLLAKQPNLEVSIIEPSKKHYYQPAWTLVGAGTFDIRETEKDEANYIPKNATWIQDAVATFQPEKNSVITKGGTEIAYDYMVVCPGIQLDWHKIKGLKESIGRNNISSNYDFHSAPYTWEMIKNFKGGTAVFTNPSTPIKCGGAPHKIMYLACDYWRKKGILDKCDVHYISGATVLFGVKEYLETLTRKVKEYGIKTHFQSNVYEVNAAEQKIYFTSKTTQEEASTKLSKTTAACYSLAEEGNASDTLNVEMKFDLCHSVPPQSAPDFIKQSPLADAANPNGYVEINPKTMQHSRYSNVFSLGDVTNAPCSKTGAAIRKQAPVVVSNMLALIENKTPTAEYTGYSACPIPTQYGKLMLAEFDYTNKPTMTFPFNQAIPRWSMWILKKYILPWLYWNKILTGKA